MNYLKQITISCIFLLFLACKSDRHKNAENTMLTNTSQNGIGVLTEANNNIKVEYPINTTFKIKLRTPTKFNNKWVLTNKASNVLSLTNTYAKVDGETTYYIFDFLVIGKGGKELLFNLVKGNEQLETYTAKIIGGTQNRVISE